MNSHKDSASGAARQQIPPNSKPVANPLHDQRRVRDSRQPGHFWADNELVDTHLANIGIYGFAVYMLLAKMANSKSGEADPSIGTIAKMLGISKPTVRKAIDTLEAGKLIEVTHRTVDEGKTFNDTNVYTLLDIKQGVVNVIDHPSKSSLPPSQSDLLGVVNHVDPNNTHNNNTHRTRIKRIAANAAAAPQSEVIAKLGVEQKQHLEEKPKPPAPKVPVKGTPPAASKSPMAHIGVIEVFVLPFKAELPPNFKLAHCAKLGLELVKAGVTVEQSAAAATLYRAWYEATPGHDAPMLSWSVGGITFAINTALSLSRSGRTPEQITGYLSAEYQRDFWHGKVISLKYVSQQIGAWLKSQESDPYPQVNEDGSWKWDFGNEGKGGAA